uniref:Uncharacterized protein n=1 Tax=Spyridia filamentosa TaxID=196632 RepID=A0A1Z1MJD6_SPYFI|nr:hypothetical protein [Spyridia filamentosa]ARW66187.1 hypothetical protein [Spyridia filamentosa]
MIRLGKRTFVKILIFLFFNLKTLKLDYCELMQV